jgi:hypothetical protein
MNSIKLLLAKLFGNGPLYIEREIEFLGHKAKMQVFNKKRLLESIEAAPAGSIMFVSARTFISIYHVDSPPSDMMDERPECDMDCEKCNLFGGYEEEADGC